MNSSEGYHYLAPGSQEDEDLSDLGELKNRRSLLTHNQKPHIIHAAIIGLLIISNITFCVLWLKARAYEKSQNVSSCVRPQLIYSPATSAIRYEKKRLWRDIDGPNAFTGKPRPEFDKAWHDIVAPITIKVSHSELQRFSEGDSTIAFKDGSGYIAELGVYHELHCAKRVRRYLSLEYYYPNITDEDRAREDAHIGKLAPKAASIPQEILIEKQTIVSSIGGSRQCAEAIRPLGHFSGGTAFRLQECTQTTSASIGMHSIIGQGKEASTWRIIHNLKSKSHSGIES
ncbi:hypothetical protein ANO14919_056170 [Xylariales sp. No.14919]|nr:hypothetical protein ANO14919_056170 [Xylariales sp. No.14919]